MQAANEKSQAAEAVAGKQRDDRQSTRRWSDQFFVLPRPAAAIVMRMVDDMSSAGNIYCNEGVATMSHETKGPSFEERVFTSARQVRCM